ncbi:MAG: M24 family metallopeptidase [Gemmatimonas sp.]
MTHVTLAEGQLYPMFSLAERDRRWALVRKLMREKNLDVIVVPNNTGHSTDFQANVRWLTHVGGGGDADISAVFPADGEPTALANRASSNWLSGAQNWTKDVRNSRRNMGQAAVDRLKELGVERGRIGITGLGAGTRTPMGTILLGFYQLIRDTFPNADLVDATDVLAEARYQKSQEEIDVLTKSQEIIEKAIRSEIQVARAGVRDWDVWATVMSTLVQNGSELPVHCNWGSGKNITYTLTRPTFRKLERGDLIINEIEASWIGYRAQGMQPLFVEVADPVHKELIKLQRDIYNALMERLKPGVTVGELARLTEEFCTKLAPNHGPAAGATALLNMHGRGQGDDGPLITPSQRRPEQLAVALKENMAFIFKPYVKTADGSSECCWGDTIVITPKGGRRLGTRPHDLAVSGA